MSNSDHIITNRVDLSVPTFQNESDMFNHILKIVATNSGKRKAVLYRMLMEAGYSQAEIGRRLGVTRSEINRILTKYI